MVDVLVENRNPNSIPKPALRKIFPLFFASLEPPPYPCRSQAPLGNASRQALLGASPPPRRSGIASPTGTIHPRPSRETESKKQHPPPTVIAEFSFRVSGMKMSATSAERRA